VKAAAVETEAAHAARRRPDEAAAAPEHAMVGSLPALSLLGLQRAAGNAAVCARLSQLSDKKSTKGEVEGEDLANVDARTPKPDAAAPVAPLAVQRFGLSDAWDWAAEKGRAAQSFLTGEVTATVPSHVRGTASPAAMADRIPPRVDTQVHVGVSGLKPGDPGVELSIEGAGGGNGTATIDGAPTKSMTAAGEVKLQGVVQTDPGKGGNLKLVAKHGGNTLDATGGFSVSAIPQNYSDTFVSLVTGPKRGFVVQDGWESDSGVFGDLDQTEISEQVEVTSATGCFAGVGKSNSGYLPGNVLSQDTHSSPVAPMTKAGDRVATQTCMFKDKRSGSNDIAMTKSGYSLVRHVRPKGGTGPGFEFQMIKTGAKVTANGISSDAGSGTIDKTQDV
jgi:hypothetical protein